MASIFARGPPPHPDVTTIPTPPLQAVGIAITFIFPAIALITVIGRVYARLKTRQWGLDDWFICAAMLFSLLMTGPLYIYIKLNFFGWHQEDVPEFDPAAGKWWFFLAQLFYNPVLALVKTSVLLFLLRIGGQKPGVRWAIHGLNVFNILQAIAIFLVALLQCLPIEANWDPVAAQNAKCVNVGFHITISCLTIFTDILVLAIPFWIFLGLNMPRPMKVALLGVFTLGISVTVVAIIRLHELYKLFYVHDPTKDPYYSIGITLNVVEVNVAIISATAPALRYLFKMWFPSLFSGSSRRYVSGENIYGTPGKYNTSPYGPGTLRSVQHDAAVQSGNGGAGIALKNMRGPRAGHSECRSISPSGSEEEIMTYNGIMRTTDVRVQFDGEQDAQSRSSSDFKQSQVKETSTAL